MTVLWSGRGRGVSGSHGSDGMTGTAARGPCGRRSHDCTARVLLPGLERDRGAEVRLRGGLGTRREGALSTGERTGGARPCRLPAAANRSQPCPPRPPCHQEGAQHKNGHGHGWLRTPSPTLDPTRLAAPKFLQTAEWLPLRSWAPVTSSLASFSDTPTPQASSPQDTNESSGVWSTSELAPLLSEILCREPANRQRQNLGALHPTARPTAGKGEPRLRA